MSKYCPKCGAEAPDDARFCLRCGTAFPEIKEEIQEPKKEEVKAESVMRKNPSPVSVADEKPKKKKKGCLVPILIVVAVIVVIIGFMSCGGGDTATVDLAKSLVFEGTDGRTIGEALEAQLPGGTWKSEGSGTAAYTGKDTGGHEWKIRIKTDSTNNTGEILTTSIDGKDYPVWQPELYSVIMDALYNGIGQNTVEILSVIRDTQLADQKAEKVTEKSTESATEAKEEQSVEKETVWYGLDLYEIPPYSGESMQAYMNACQGMTAKEAMRSDHGTKIRVAGKITFVNRDSNDSPDIITIDVTNQNGERETWRLIDCRLDKQTKFLQDDYILAFGDFTGIEEGLFGELPFITARFIELEVEEIAGAVDQIYSVIDDMNREADRMRNEAVRINKQKLGYDENSTDAEILTKEFEGTWRSEARLDFIVIKPIEKASGDYSNLIGKYDYIVEINYQDQYPANVNGNVIEFETENGKCVLRLSFSPGSPDEVTYAKEFLQSDTTQSKTGIYLVAPRIFPAIKVTEYEENDLARLISASEAEIINYIDENGLVSQGFTEIGEAFSNDSSTVIVTVENGKLMGIWLEGDTGKSLFGVTPRSTEYTTARPILGRSGFAFIYDVSENESVYYSAKGEEVTLCQNSSGRVTGIGYTPFVYGE